MGYWVLIIPCGIFNPIWDGAADSVPPHDFSDSSTQEDHKSGGHGLCKSKFLHWEVLGSDQEVVEVEPEENLSDSKSEFLTFISICHPKIHSLINK